MTTIVKIMPITKMHPTARTVSARQSGQANRLVALLTYDGVNAFNLAAAHEVFGLSNMGSDWYRVAVCNERPGDPCRTGAQLQVVADSGLSAVANAGTVVVPGWHDIDVAPPPALLATLRCAHDRGARIMSICSGTFVLAAAGLLDGRRVTTHWAHADLLAMRYPSLKVDASVLYVDDGDVLTSAGRAAGLDLCVHVVRRDFGPEVANNVARRLVIPSHREGGQAQLTPRPVCGDGEPLADLLAWARAHLGEDLSIERLAEKAHMSRRTFIRRFEEATGVSPGRWVMQERLSKACALLEGTDWAIEAVATTTGFGSAGALRHHFREQLHTSPGHYRSSFRPSVRHIASLQAAPDELARRRSA
jgi:AraC family transcriptional activator FtrA